MRNISAFRLGQALGKLERLQSLGVYLDLTIEAWQRDLEEAERQALAALKELKDQLEGLYSVIYNEAADLEEIYFIAVRDWSEFIRLFEAVYDGVCAIAEEVSYYIYKGEHSKAFEATEEGISQLIDLFWDLYNLCAFKEV